MVLGMVVPEWYTTGTFKYEPFKGCSKVEEKFFQGSKLFSFVDFKTERW
jgi:hypothetical protein